MAEERLVAGDPERALSLLGGLVPSSDEARRGAELRGRAHLALAVRSLTEAWGEAGVADAQAHAARLLQAMREGGVEPAPDVSGDRLEALRVSLVLETLAACDWVQSAAADQLGISKYQMHRLLRKHDLLDAVRERRVSI